MNIVNIANILDFNEMTNFSVKKGTLTLRWVLSPGPFDCRSMMSKILDSIPSGVETVLFSQKQLSNMYLKFHLVLNDVNSKSQVDKVDMVEFGYHGE